MWLVAIAGGVLAVVTGLLPLTGTDSVVSVSQRVGPVLVFLVAITVLAQLADEAQVFDVVADRTARLAGGSVRRLFVLVVVLGWAVTVVLSLDTTAVLLTPVVLALAGRLGLAPAPFAYAAVWLANTGSLLLPVSNLTNLLAVGRLGLSATAYAERMAAPALVALAASLAVLGVWFRRELTGGYRLPEPVIPADRTLFRVAAAACLAVGPGFVAGLPVQDVALAAALPLVVAFAVRRRKALRFALVPWRLVLLVGGLFCAVTGLLRLPVVAGVLHTAVGSGTGIAGTLRTAGVAAAASNALNNLPTSRWTARSPPGIVGSCWRCCLAPTWGRWCCCSGRWRRCCGGSAAPPVGCRSRLGSSPAWAWSASRSCWLPAPWPWSRPTT